MKKLLIFLFISAFITTQAQIVVDIRDNAQLQFKSALVKMRGTVNSFTFNPQGEFSIDVTIKYYENNAGAYGPYIQTTITGDNTLTADERSALQTIYADRVFHYSTVGQWVNASGDVVPIGTPGATTEIAYWQAFKLNQVAGVVSISATGALQATYLTITAIVNKMNARKNW